MPETYTATSAATGTWTEAEIRQQPACWIRSLSNIDNLRSAIDDFLAPLLRKDDLRIVLTGQEPPPLSVRSLRHGYRAIAEKTSARCQRPTW